MDHFFIDVIAHTIIFLVVVPAILFLIWYEMRWVIGKNFIEKQRWVRATLAYGVVVIIVETVYYLLQI